MAYGVSDRFKTAVLQSHQVTCRVDITEPSTGEVLYTLGAVNDGQVTEDRTASVRRTGDVLVIDDTGSLTPTDVDDLLMPFGNEYRPYAGVIFSDGTSELVPLGVMSIEACTIEDSGDNFSMRIEGKDRSAKISRAGFQDTLYIPSQTSVNTAINMIIAATGVQVDTDFDLGEDKFIASQTFNIGDDPWTGMLQLATSCACDLFFDEVGTLVKRMLTNPYDDDVDWTITDDAAFGNLLAIERRIQREDTFYNYWIVTGENPENNVAIPTGVAYDDDPSSPTYIRGKYGIQMNHVQDTNLTSNADCQASAQHLLEESIGLSEEQTPTFLPNPAIQATDIITVTRSESKLNGIRTVADQTSHSLSPTRASTAILRRLLRS